MLSSFADWLIEVHLTFSAAQLLLVTAAVVSFMLYPYFNLCNACSNIRFVFVDQSIYESCLNS